MRRRLTDILSFRWRYVFLSILCRFSLQFESIVLILDDRTARTASGFIHCLYFGQSIPNPTYIRPLPSPTRIHAFGIVHR